MASLPYPLNRLVYSCLCGYGRDAIPSYRYPFFCFSKTCSSVLLSFPNNMFSCSSVFSNNNMFSCPHVFKITTCSHVLMSSKQQHVLMSSCLQNKNMFSCPLVFSTTTCSHVLLSFQKQHVLMFSCLSKKHVLLSFPQKSHVLHPILSLCRQKKNG